MPSTHAKNNQPPVSIAITIFTSGLCYCCSYGARTCFTYIESFLIIDLIFLPRSLTTCSNLLARYLRSSSERGNPRVSGPNRRSISGNSGPRPKITHDNDSDRPNGSLGGESLIYTLAFPFPRDYRPRPADALSNQALPVQYSTVLYTCRNQPFLSMFLCCMLPCTCTNKMAYSLFRLLG